MPGLTRNKASYAARIRRRRHHARRRAEKAEDKHELERLKKAAENDTEEKRLAQEPHSMVIHRGRVGRYLKNLVMNIRKILEPNSAMKLKVLRRNNLKDFVVNGAPLGLTHLLVITKTDKSVILRVIRCPQGPTITFRVNSYTLARHVVSSQKRPLHFQKQYMHPPLVVMNGFNDSSKKHLKLVQTMFQSMFPSIAVDTIKLSNIRRCCLVAYDKEKDCFELRHYAIKAVPTGISKSAKKLLQSKVPDLSRYRDISDFVLNPGQLSESEFEGEQKEVELSQDLSTRGCKEGQKINVRLIELGPRLTFSLIKIVDGMNDGEVLYHSYIVKTPKEVEELRKQLSAKKKMKERRLLREEHRVIKTLTNIAAEKKRALEIEEREKERLIEQQRAVTGVEDDEEDDIETIKRKRKNDEDGGEEEGGQSSASKRGLLIAERKNRQSDGLTRAERRKQKAEAAFANRNKVEAKRKRIH